MRQVSARGRIRKNMNLTENRSIREDSECFVKSGLRRANILSLSKSLVKCIIPIVRYNIITD